MSFSADWLTLRAPADDRARDQGLLTRLQEWADDRPLLITDIGGGSGATRRVLAPLLPAARWRIIDNDATLLSRIPAAADVETLVADLAKAPEAAFTPAPDLITASAFFDLVSAEWIAEFVELLARNRSPLYAALTYDGRETWHPAPPFEAEALAAFHKDMRTDKSFGPALGPDAPAALKAALQCHGYQVHEAKSDWQLTANDAELIETLAQGGAEAGEVKKALPADALRQWQEGRAAAQSVLIGHIDILAFPA